MKRRCVCFGSVACGGSECREVRAGTQVSVCACKYACGGSDETGYGQAWAYVRCE